MFEPDKKSLEADLEKRREELTRMEAAPGNEEMIEKYRKLIAQLEAAIAKA